MKKLKAYLSLWYRKMFGVLTLGECKSEGLIFMHNIYGEDAVRVYKCRSIWRDKRCYLYKCDTFIKKAEF